MSIDRIIHLVERIKFYRSISNDFRAKAISAADLRDTNHRQGFYPYADIMDGYARKNSELQQFTHSRLVQALADLKQEVNP